MTGSSRDEALSLAQEYEARAQELDKVVAVSPNVESASSDGENAAPGNVSTRDHAVSGGGSMSGGGLAERIAALIGERGAQVEAIRARERDYESKLAAARVERSLLEARIAGIIEASSQLSLPGSLSSVESSNGGERLAK